MSALIGYRGRRGCDLPCGVGKVVWEGLPQEELLAELDLEEWMKIPQLDHGGEERGALGRKCSECTGKPAV